MTPDARPPGARHPKAVVERGYDVIAERYAAWSLGIQDEARERHIDLLLARVPAGAPLLELGCGGGGPTTQRLARHCALTGVDISARQIALARRNVPAATFMHGDMTALDFPPASFAAVAAFYTLTHVPRDEQGALLARIARWLRPGGLFVATLGASSTPGAIEDDWLGAPMYFSHFDSATNQRLVEAAGLRIERAREETILEEGKPTTFLWVVAEKP